MGEPAKADDLCLGRFAGIGKAAGQLPLDAGLVAFAREHPVVL